MNFSPARGTLIRGLLFFLLWWGGGAAAAGAEDNSEKLLKHGKVQVKPKPLARPAPVYPPELIRLGLEGRVTLRFVIDKEGAVTNPVVVQSNNPWFERPAITALLQWKFTPALVDGQAVNTRTQQEIVFDLWYGRGTPWTLTHTKAKNALPPEMRWDVAPEPVHTAYPVYPFDALQAGLAGKTRVLYVIDERGVVTETKLLEATTPEMGHAAIAMIDTWRFKPARRKDGTAIRTALGMEHEFSPQNWGDVPVSEEARDILRDLKKRPQAIVAADTLDRALKPLSRRPPVYPTALANAGQPGEAIIEFFVDRNGDAQLPRIISSTAPEFGFAAAQAVATWRFEVPRKAGNPVVVRVRIPVSFSLAEPKTEARKNE